MMCKQVRCCLRIRHLCLQVHDRSEVQTKDDDRSQLSPEVALLQDVFPTVSPEALMNALSVSDNNVETAKQVQIYLWSQRAPESDHTKPSGSALQLSSAALSAGLGL